MTVILLADDSPHALRMGHAILSEEGYRVVSMKEGAGAAGCVAELDPILVIAGVSLPGGGGLRLCRYIKLNHPHVKVILAAGMTEPLDDLEAKLAGCDAVLRKPFEASAMLDAVRPLLQTAEKERASVRPATAPLAVNAEELRAAIVLAVEAELPRFVEEVAQKVFRELASREPASADVSKAGLVA